MQDEASPSAVEAQSCARIEKVEQRNITADLVRHAQATPDAPALLLPDREISYLEVNDLTWRFAQHLWEQGVRAGHVVGMTFVDEPTLVLTMLALTRLGATVVSIPRSATPMQGMDMAARARVAVLATDQPDRFDAGVPFLQIDRHALAGARMQINPAILSENPSAPWLLITGSGTTGRPKLIPVTHAQEAARSSMASSWLGIDPTDRISSLSHFDFAHPKHRLHEALRAGASYGLSAGVTIDPLVLCRQLSLTVLHITVFHAEKMLAGLPRSATAVLGAIRALSIGASTVSDELRQRIRRSLCPNLLVRYASNETGPIAVAASPGVDAISGTVGTPLPGLQVQIVDRSMQTLAAEVIGLIRIRSPGLIDGYIDDDDATAQSFQGGWFLPGDLGKLTEDGQLIHCGRADDMMIMNGINIYPAEIEQVICGHPAVRDAAAMPIKHKAHQDVPICAVALHPGAHVSEQTLLSYARERLGYRAPHRVVNLDQIPRTERGKLVRSELSRQIAGKLGLRFHS
ncbi:MAG: acyl--CoA ligase [Rubrivivax sp.]|nr:acyl--CoA ligase [Rubrivivax sp.]